MTAPVMLDANPDEYTDFSGNNMMRIVDFDPVTDDDAAQIARILEISF